MTASSEIRLFATLPEDGSPASNRTPVNSAVIIQFVDVLFFFMVASEIGGKRRPGLELGKMP